jgi:hypothetical protein
LVPIARNAWAGNLANFFAIIEIWKVKNKISASFFNFG